MFAGKWICVTFLCLFMPITQLLLAETPRGGNPANNPESKSSVPSKAIDDSEAGLEAAQRYMRLHHRLSLSSRNWTETPDKIGETGDAFTLYIMKRRIEQKIQPVETQLRQQIISQIEKRRGRNPDKIRVEEVGFLLNKAIYVDPVVCNPTHHLMIKWLKTQTKSHLDDRGMRERLEELRTELRLKPRADDVRIGDDERWVDPAVQMRRYFDQLLERN